MRGDTVFHYLEQKFSKLRHLCCFRLFSFTSLFTAVKYHVTELFNSVHVVDDDDDDSITTTTTTTTTKGKVFPLQARWWPRWWVEV